MPENDKCIEQAKFAVMVELREPFYQGNIITMNDLEVIWFVQILNNWKAVVRTDKLHGFLAQVTFDGSTDQAEVATYRKLHNRTVNIPHLNQLYKEI